MAKIHHKGFFQCLQCSLVLPHFSSEGISLWDFLQLAVGELLPAFCVHHCSKKPKNIPTIQWKSERIARECLTPFPHPKLCFKQSPINKFLKAALTVSFLGHTFPVLNHSSHRIFLLANLMSFSGV